MEARSSPAVRMEAYTAGTKWITQRRKVEATKVDHPALLSREAAIYFRWWQKPAIMIWMNVSSWDVGLLDVFSLGCWRWTLIQVAATFETIISLFASSFPANWIESRSPPFKPLTWLDFWTEPVVVLAFLVSSAVTGTQKKHLSGRERERRKRKATKNWA